MLTREPGGQGLEFVVRSHQAHQLLQSPIDRARHHWPELPRSEAPPGLRYGPSHRGAWTGSPCTARLVERGQLAAPGRDP